MKEKFTNSKSNVDLTNYVFKDDSKIVDDKYYYKTEYDLSSSSVKLYRTISNVSLVFDGARIRILNDSDTVLALEYQDMIIINTDIMSYNYGGLVYVLIQFTADDVTVTNYIVQLTRDPDTLKYTKTGLVEEALPLSEMEMLRLSPDTPGHLYNYQNGAISCWEIQDTVLKGIHDSKGSYTWCYIYDAVNPIVDFYYNPSKKVCCYLDSSNALYGVNVTHGTSTLITNYYLYNSGSNDRITVDNSLLQVLYVKEDTVYKASLSDYSIQYTYDVGKFVGTITETIWNVDKDLLIVNKGTGVFCVIDLRHQTHAEKNFSYKHILLCQSSTLIIDDTIRTAEVLENSVVDCSGSTITAADVIIRVNETTQVSLKDIWLEAKRRV
jgi:hypothetical protein